jgi:tetratricopeptide (TPR) repeat protein
MIVKRFFLAILILNLLKVNSQSIDSLLLVSQSLKTDTARINLFYKEGFANRFIDSQYSFDCAKELEKCAKKVNVPKHMAKSNFLFGVLYYRKGDLNTALSYYKKALNIYTDLNHKKGIAACQTNLGNIFVEFKRYKLAEDAYLKALEVNNELNVKVEVGTCLLNLGVLRAEMASASKDSSSLVIAKKYFEKALENAKVRNDYELEAECLNNLAVVNTILKQFDAAIANAINSIKIKNIMENEMEMADSYLNMAVAYLKKGDLNLCKENVGIADSIIDKYNYFAAQIQSLKLKAELYEKEKNFEQAYRSMVLFKKLSDSLEGVKKQLQLENNFTERFNVDKAKAAEKTQSVPILFFNILAILCILIIGFVFKFKR